MSCDFLESFVEQLSCNWKNQHIVCWHRCNSICRYMVYMILVSNLPFLSELMSKLNKGPPVPLDGFDQAIFALRLILLWVSWPRNSCLLELRLLYLNSFLGFHHFDIVSLAQTMHDWPLCVSCLFQTVKVQPCLSMLFSLKFSQWIWRIFNFKSSHPAEGQND